MLLPNKRLVADINGAQRNLQVDERSIFPEFLSEGSTKINGQWNQCQTWSVLIML